MARPHRLGPRVLREFLVEFAAARLLRTPIEEMVGRYGSRLDADVLAGIGADRFPPHPVHIVYRGDG